MTEKSKPRKPIYRTDTPYSRTEVTRLSQPHHDVVIDLLFNALSPIGLSKARVPKSKGKRTRKRKRDDENGERAAKPPAQIEDSITQVPAIISHVLVGFNSVNRYLGTLSAISGKRLGIHQADNDVQDIARPSHVAAVFLLRPLDDVIYDHLPTLCCTASLAHPEAPATRFILLDPAVEKRMAEALGQPTVSIVALTAPEDAGVFPGLKAVLDYVQTHVEAVDAGWLKEATDAKWIGTNLDVQ